jgi:hypothetical protein
MSGHQEPAMGPAVESAELKLMIKELEEALALL